MKLKDICLTVRMNPQMLVGLRTAAENKGLDYRSVSNLVKLIVEEFVLENLKPGSEVENLEDPKGELKRQSKANRERTANSEFKSFEDWQKAERQLKEGEQGDKIEGRTNPR